MAYSAYTLGLQMDAVQNISFWLGLCHTDPANAADPLTTEYSYAGYSRSTGLYQRVSPVSLRVSSASAWNGLDVADEPVAVAAFDAAINGNFLWAAYFSSAVSLGSGTTRKLAADQIYLNAS